MFGLSIRVAVQSVGISYVDHMITSTYDTLQTQVISRTQAKRRLKELPKVHMFILEVSMDQAIPRAGRCPLLWNLSELPLHLWRIWNITTGLSVWEVRHILLRRVSHVKMS